MYGDSYSLYMCVWGIMLYIISLNLYVCVYQISVGTFKTSFKKVKITEPQWKKEPTFVEEKEDEYKEENDAGRSVIHEHEPENDANPNISKLLCRFRINL